MADAPRVPTTPTFPEWLGQQQDRGDAIAEFAKQAAQLEDLPSHGGKSIYDGYFETALPAQQDEFERAWSEFSASPEPSTS